MAMKHGLGRGFESLIPTGLIDDSFDPNSTYDPTASEDKSVSKQQALALSALKADKNQPRKAFDDEALRELAESIKEHGVLQPLVVTPLGSGAYQIVAGERRYRASKLAGLTEVPVVIRTLTDQNRLEISLIENIQRRDLNSIETATAYAKLRDQFNLTIDQIASRVHKSVSAVSNTMRLLKLPKEAIEAVANGALTEGQVKPLIGQDESMVREILPKIIAESWSARKVEQYVINMKKSANGAVDVAENSMVTAQNDQRVQVLTTRLNTKVDVRTNRKGAGKIVIAFKDSDDFERIQKLLGS